MVQFSVRTYHILSPCGEYIIIFHYRISKQLPFFSILNNMLQYQFVKCFDFINMRKQVLTGVKKNTASSCLISQSYFLFLHSISLPSFHALEDPSWWQNHQACFAVISLIIVDSTGRIPLPSVIPLCHWLSTALSCRPPFESPVLLTVSP